MRNKKSKISIGIIFSRIYVYIYVVIVLFPLLWMFSISLRTPIGMQESYFFLIPKTITFANYIQAWKWTNTPILEQGAAIVPPLKNMFINSISITVISLVCTLLIAVIGAYAFSKFKFKGRNIIFISILLGMMIPVQVTLIPIFILTKYMGLLNSYFGLVLIYIAFGLPFALFLLRGFFNQIPIEFSEAAIIDGASHPRILFSIILPLSKPVISACVIVLSMFFWNEFIFALIFLQDKAKFTVQVSLSKFSEGMYYFPIGQFAALIFVSSIPILIIYIIFQNWFIKGLTTGGIKG